jgi:predicted metal-dependent hydrolase
MEHAIELPKLRRGTKARRHAVALMRALAHERLAHFNQQYGLAIGKISIRNQKTRWGSCSREGNLSFNYRILYLPSAERDYIIVHELCHIAEHNHSPAFWALVSRALPDAKLIRKELRRKYLL